MSAIRIVISVYMGATLLISNKNFKLFLLSELLLILFINFIGFVMW